jgi:hypothetical protein
MSPAVDVRRAEAGDLGGVHGGEHYSGVSASRRRRLAVGGRNRVVAMDFRVRQAEVGSKDGDEMARDAAESLIRASELDGTVSGADLEKQPFSAFEGPATGHA